MRTDDQTNLARGQIIINQGDTRTAGAAELRGLVAPDYFAFHSTSSNLLVKIPRVSDFYFATIPGLTSPGGAPSAASATLSPDEQRSSFEANSTPIAPVSDPASATTPGPKSTPNPYAVILPAPEGLFPMHPNRCPIMPGLDKVKIRISAESGGGNIRIYQNLP